jgi:large subunit ribosomal protein L32e
MTEQNQKAAEKALKLRKRLKSKKPNFVRPESWRYVRLKENWRRPRGLDHKTRLKYDGWPPGVSIGYRGPKEARGLHPSGYKEVLVYNPEGLDEIDPTIQVARIAHTVGKRKRARIFSQAKKKGIRILNVKEFKEVVTKEKESPEEKLEEQIEEEETKEIEESGQKKGKTKKREEAMKKQ